MLLSTSFVPLLPALAHSKSYLVQPTLLHIETFVASVAFCHKNSEKRPASCISLLTISTL